MPMKFLTKEIKDRLPPLYATEGVKADDKIVQCKFFSIFGRGTWLAVEYDPKEKVFFGFVISPLGDDCDEWVYFSEDELRTCKIGCCPAIERDLYFKPGKFSEVVKQEKGEVQ